MNQDTSSEILVLTLVSVVNGEEVDDGNLKRWAGKGECFKTAEFFSQAAKLSLQNGEHIEDASFAGARNVILVNVCRPLD